MSISRERLIPVLDWGGRAYAPQQNFTPAKLCQEQIPLVSHPSCSTGCGTCSAPGKILIAGEEAQVDWAKRFVSYHRKRHPQEMGGPEIEGFLSYLAVTRHVSASTQTQALCALLFLYKQVLMIELPNLDGPDRSIMSTEFAHSRNGMFEIDRPEMAATSRFRIAICVSQASR